VQRRALGEKVYNKLVGGLRGGKNGRGRVGGNCKRSARDKGELGDFKTRSVWRMDWRE